MVKSLVISSSWTIESDFGDAADYFLQRSHRGRRVFAR